MIGRSSQIILALSLLVFVACCPSAMAISGKAKITIKVVDEQGQPVKGARVGIGFQYDKPWATDSRGKSGLSDETGRFSASGSGNGHIGYGADKDGYYDNQYYYDFKDKGTLRWKPWNPELEVVLRKIENPVPMYARDTKQSLIEIPVNDKEIGFDLIAYDWLPPYGNGQIADFTCVFTRDSDAKNPRVYSLHADISFPGKFNGIQSIDEDIRYGSYFKLARYAPIDGYYQHKEVFRSASIRDAHNMIYRDSGEKNRSYFLRVRGEVVEGKLARAMYGKILGDFSIGWSFRNKVNTLEFKYYLNPDYTRNLEFDTDQNLFKGLPDREQVGIK